MTPITVSPPAKTQNTDFLYAFTGIAGADVAAALKTALDKRGDLQTEVLERLMRHPLESLVGFLLSTSAAFYLAEREANPKINTFVDALYYISTCLSVGYADIFAQTQAGKLIATLVMTVGPALTGSALDLPGHAVTASTQGQEIMIARLEAILEELRQRPLAG
jgi:voltage-gated potassium channel